MSILTNAKALAGQFWDFIKGKAQQEGKQLLYVEIPAERTEVKDDAKSPLTVLKPQRSYFRLWLCEMFLTDSRKWFIDYYPAVHSSVQLKFGDYPDAKRFSYVAPAVPSAVGSGVSLNYRLTELLPYNGGVVEIQAALLALMGKNHLAATLRVFQSFSDLVKVPLGQVLSLAEKITAGAQEMLGAADGEVLLPLHQSFIAAGGGGAHVLRAGYFAVVLVTEQQLPRERFWVKGDRLYYAANPGATPQPLVGYDYMLFRIEGREERDDYMLKDINEPFQRAVEALLKKNKKEAETYKQAALAAAALSPDLAFYDRIRVVEVLQNQLKEFAKPGQGAVGGGPPNLTKLLHDRGKTMDWAVAKGELTVEGILAL